MNRHTTPDDSAIEDVPGWIEAARNDRGDTLGRLVERCRRYLLLVANRELDHEIRSKVGPSDLVQETIIAAQRCFGQFRGTSEEELRSWLRKILINRVARTSRRFRRVTQRELSLNQSPSGDSAQFNGVVNLIDQAAQPAAAAIVVEQFEALEAALRRLPEHYRQVILLRNIERLSFIDIGAQLQATPGAARKLWLRALQQLRAELGGEHDPG